MYYDSVKKFFTLDQRKYSEGGRFELGAHTNISDKWCSGSDIIISLI